MKNKMLITFLLLVFSLLLGSCNNSETKEDATYIVSFVSNGGTNINPITVIEGNVIGEVNPPSKAQNDFKGWFIDKELTEQWLLLSDPVRSDITLYAKWEEIVIKGEKVEVTFDYNYEGSPINIVTEINKGDKVSKIADPVRNGYNFIGWTINDSESLFDFEMTIDTDLTLLAKWEEIIVVVTYYTVTIDHGYDNLTTEVSVVSDELFTEKPPTRDGHIFSGYTLDGKPFNLTTDKITKDLTLLATWVIDPGLEGSPITNANELVNLFETGGSGQYYLLNDIDMTGVNYQGSKVEFSGVLDGNGKTIRNLHVVSLVNKTGAFFGKLMPGAEIKNLMIMNSSLEVNGEGAGFIAVYGYGGTTFDNITFLNVSINQTENSYAGLLYADDQNNPSKDAINIKNIIVINNDDNYINANQHGGVLIGTLRNENTINFENLYIQTDIVAVSSNAAVLVARVQSGAANTTLNVNGFVYKGKVESSNDVAIISGQSNTTLTINLSNLYLHNAMVVMNGSGSHIDLFAARRGVVVITTNNVYYTSTVKVEKNGTIQNINSEATLLAEVNETWFNNSEFDQNFFKLENGDIMQQLDLGPSTPENIIIGRDSYNEIIVKDIDTHLNLEDLIVSLAYTDGKTEILKQDEYEVDLSFLNLTKTGEYEIFVRYNDFITSFKVSVVEIEELKTYLYNQQTVFKLGDIITENAFNNLEVNALLTNGERLYLSSDYVLDFSKVTQTIGEHDVTVIFRDHYESSFKITIIENYLTPINNEVTIQVDHATLNSGAVINNVLTTKTVSEAFQIIKDSKLQTQVIKRVLIKDGTYFEKLTLNIPNVHLIGESQQNTILDYNMASGNMTPTLGEWGTQGSASFTLGSGSTGFIAYNLTFSNSFDYYNATVSNKQAVAIVIQADQSIFHKVSFLGLQDTLYAKDGRQWYLDVYVEGIVDYIFGNGGPAYFEESEIKTLNRHDTSSNGVITAQKGVAKDGITPLDYGYVFYNNDFTIEAGSTTKVDLGRPWGRDANVAYIENRFGSFISSAGWVEMSGNKPEDANFFEYGNMIGDNLYKSTIGTHLTELESENYINKDIVFGQTNGGYNFGSEWNYQQQLSLIPES